MNKILENFRVEPRKDWLICDPVDINQFRLLFVSQLNFEKHFTLFLVKLTYVQWNKLYRVFTDEGTPNSTYFDDDFHIFLNINDSLEKLEQLLLSLSIKGFQKQAPFEVHNCKVFESLTYSLKKTFLVWLGVVKIQRFWNFDYGIAQRVYFLQVYFKDALACNTGVSFGSEIDSFGDDCFDSYLFRAAND